MLNLGNRGHDQFDGAAVRSLLQLVFYLKLRELYSLTVLSELPVDNLGSLYFMSLHMRSEADLQLSDGVEHGIAISLYFCTVDDCGRGRQQLQFLSDQQSF